MSVANEHDCYWRREAHLLTKERDEAVEWIGVVGEELALAGFGPGDCEVSLAHIRLLLQEHRLVMGHQNLNSTEQTPTEKLRDRYASVLNEPPDRDSADQPCGTRADCYWVQALKPTDPTFSDREAE